MTSKSGACSKAYEHSHRLVSTTVTQRATTTTSTVRGSSTSASTWRADIQLQLPRTTSRGLH